MAKAGTASSSAPVTGKGRGVSRPAVKAATLSMARPAKAKKMPPPKVAFPKKNQPPAPAQFVAMLPLPVGKRLEGVRSFLLKQRDVTEDVYFYGPKSGWGLRYLAGGRPVCTLFVHGDRPLGIVSLDAEASGTIDWKALSEVGQKARRAAHGSPALLWLDVALDASGAGDFRTILKAKIEGLRG
jgi:hypothetical protein